MSENIPESVPTSVSNRSQRPTKKRALTPVSKQSEQVEALFANPDRADIAITLGPRSKNLTAPPEIVANVQGSSAGAGSGEFHVYKASRRREYERLRMMDEEVKEEEAEQDFQARKEELARKDEERLSKNRAKREKAKKRQEKRKAGASGGTDLDKSGPEENTGNGDGVKKKLGPAKVAAATTGRQNEAEESVENEQPVQEETGITIHDDD